ncbi:MAG: ABC transporter family substrate-binding protein [Actinomycetaceae bacterium]|nr:ABC transporter family substrate-binding protein [Actinomycetaceae bacterium]
MKRVYSLVAAGAAAALVLSACGSNSGGKSKVEGASTNSVGVTVGSEEYTGYNHFMSTTYSTSNAVINERLMTAFGYYDAEGKWTHGTDLGDYEKVSDDPLQVKYTINDEAVYQGGTEITCEDFYMDWVSQNPQWILDAQAAAGETSDDGQPTPLFNSVADPENYAQPVTEGPECNAGDREFTVTYAEPNPDWEINVTYALPSHVMAKKLGMSKTELFDKLKAKDFGVAQKLAEEWNNWRSKTAGEVPSVDEAPSFGPFTYKEDGWKKGEYVTLVPNPDWWGEKPTVDELVFKQIAPEAQLQALKNGEVNVIEPQATQDAIETLEQMDNATLLQGPTQIWEHLDFNFGESSVFSDSQGGLALRQAFAYCVPRQDIVDKLIKPLDDSATVLNAREYLPTNEDYEQVVSASYDGTYNEVDIDKAKELVAQSGVENPTIRIAYQAPNQRRSDTVDLIASSCEQAGFKVENAGDEKFFEPGGSLETGDYEIALFAWSGSGQIVAGANYYISGGQQNYGGYSNATMDEEWTKVKTSLDPTVWLSSKEVIEKTAWDTMYNIPLYVHPGIAAHTKELGNVERNISQTGIVWNAEKWKWSEAK